MLFCWCFTPKHTKIPVQTTKVEKYGYTNNIRECTYLTASPQAAEAVGVTGVFFWEKTDLALYLLLVGGGCWGEVTAYSSSPLSLVSKSFKTSCELFMPGVTGIDFWAVAGFIPMPGEREGPKSWHTKYTSNFKIISWCYLITINLVFVKPVLGFLLAPTCEGAWDRLISESTLIFLLQTKIIFYTLTHARNTGHCRHVRTRLKRFPRNMEIAWNAWSGS